MQVDELVSSIDASAKRYEELQTFQSLLPVTEICFVSERREMLKRGRVEKLRSDLTRRSCCTHQHARFETVELVLMTDCLLVCQIRQNDNANVSERRA